MVITLLVFSGFLVVSSIVSAQSRYDKELNVDTTTNKEPSRPIVSIHLGLGASNYGTTFNGSLQYSTNSQYIVSLNVIGAKKISYSSSSEYASSFNILLGWKNDIEEPKIIGYLGVGRTRISDFTTRSSEYPESFKRLGITGKGQFFLAKGTGFGLTLTP